MLVTITPAGIETVFAELAALTTRPPDLTRVAEVIGRYGISFANVGN